MAATWVKHPDVTLATNVYGYWQFTPDGANENTPLLIFWHGSGEQGGGNSTDLDKLTTQSLPKLINDNMGTGNEFPHHCIVICPQYVGTPLGGFAFQSVINWVRANKTFDHSKLHLAGYSLGGACIANWWDVGTLEHVASCYLIAPSLTYFANAGARLAASGMPILFSHGDGDTGFTAYSNSTGWVTNLTADGVLPTPILDTLPGEGHNIDELVHNWTNYYPVTNGQDAIEWQLQFQRIAGLTPPLIASSNTVHAPLVTGGDLGMLAPLINSGSSVFSPTVSTDAVNWSQVGSSAAVTNLVSPRMAALSSTRIVLWNNGAGNKRFEVWDFDGTNWSLTATLAAGTQNNACVARVTASRFVSYDENLARMRVYNISGSTISSVGNFLDLSGPASPRALGLAENQWVITDGFSSSLRVYSFDGTNITQVGSEFANAGGSNSAMARLTDTRIVLYDQISGNRYRILDWNGTSWSVFATIGSQSADSRSLAGLASDKFAVFNDTTDVLSVLQLSGTSLVDLGINLTISGSSSSAIGGLNTSRVAWVDDTNDSLRTYDFGSGPSSQDLTVPLISNAQSFFSPTVSPGQVSLTLPLISSSGNVLVPVVSAGASSVAPELLSNPNGFFAPTVSVGSVTIAAPLIESTAQFFSPVVSAGQIVLAVPLISNASQFFAHTISAGPTTISAPLIESAAQAFTPAIGIGGVVVAPELFANASQFFGPSVIAGDVQLSASLINGGGLVYEPVVSSGQVVITAPLIESASALFSPIVVQPAAQAIVAQLISSSSIVLLPQVSQSGVVARAFWNGSWVPCVIRAWDGQAWNSNVMVNDGNDFVQI